MDTHLTIPCFSYQDIKIIIFKEIHDQRENKWLSLSIKLHEIKRTILFPIISPEILPENRRLPSIVQDRTHPAHHPPIHHIKIEKNLQFPHAAVVPHTHR